MYNKIYPDSCVLQVARLAKTCSKVKNLGVTLSVNSCRTERYACVLAKWCAGNSSFEEPVLDPNADVHPGIIRILSASCLSRSRMPQLCGGTRGEQRPLFLQPGGRGVTAGMDLALAAQEGMMAG